MSLLRSEGVEMWPAARRIRRCYICAAPGLSERKRVCWLCQINFGISDPRWVDLNAPTYSQEELDQAYDGRADALVYFSETLRNR